MQYIVLFKVVKNKSKILAFLADHRPLIKMLGRRWVAGAEAQGDRSVHSGHLTVFLGL